MEIKATELRIGNLVEINLFGKKNKDEDDYEIPSTGITINHLVSFFEISIRPIPITEQWLLGFGFKEKSFDFTIPISECELVKLMLIPHDEFPSESSVCVIQSNEDDSEEETVFLSDIKYIHQLQNLYFALTGKELIKTK